MDHFHKPHSKMNVNRNRLITEEDKTAVFLMLRVIKLYFISVFIRLLHK